MPSAVLDRSQQTSQYGQGYNSQPQTSFNVQQRFRPMSRMIQPDMTRNIQLPSSGYRR